MSTDDANNTAAGDDLPADVVGLLADEAVWADVDSTLEDDVIAAIMSEASMNPSPSATAPGAASRSDSSTVTPINSARSRPWLSALAGAAAALVLVIGGLGIARALRNDVDLELALSGTDLAPAASAIAEITELDEGTRIVIEVDQLPPASPGTYYQAWLRIDADIGVSAGTFHLRDGNGPIELWAGVTPDEYPLLTVTIQDEAQTESSGRVVLKGRIGDG